MLISCGEKIIQKKGEEQLINLSQDILIGKNKETAPKDTDFYNRESLNDITIENGNLFLPSSAIDSITKLPIGIACSNIDYRIALDWGRIHLDDYGHIQAYDSVTGQEVVESFKKETINLSRLVEKHRFLYKNVNNIKKIKVKSVEIINRSRFSQDESSNLYKGIIDSIKYRLPNFENYQVYFSCFSISSKRSTYLINRYQDLVLYDTLTQKVKVINLASRTNHELGGILEEVFCIDNSYIITNKRYMFFEGTIESPSKEFGKDTIYSLKFVLNKSK